MNFFSDDHAAELRELFFESATELLQTLNEEGLELEKRPEDEEVLRQVRRTVHTLKGDSAACGYTELSELAHALEDVLRPDIAAVSKTALAEVVLIAADTFSSMLSAYRGSLQPPARGGGAPGSVVSHGARPDRERHILFNPGVSGGHAGLAPNHRDGSGRNTAAQGAYSL